MANIKAKIKNIKKNQQQNARNRHVKSQVKTAIKKAKESVINNKENQSDLIALAHKQINVAISKGIIHKNNGARKASRLDHFVHKHQNQQKQSN